MTQKSDFYRKFFKWWSKSDSFGKKVISKKHILWSLMKLITHSILTISLIVNYKDQLSFLHFEIKPLFGPYFPPYEFFGQSNNLAFREFDPL